MAVTMTTKFYEEDSPAWHDLSKVVFTSPNIVSPNTAGTRSHILPGKGDLALWYEDSSNMYEIEPSQSTFDTSFYYYRFTVASGNSIDLDASPTSALIGVGNYPQFITFIKDELGVEAIGYIDLTGYSVDLTLKLEYTITSVNGVDNAVYHVYSAHSLTNTSIDCVSGGIPYSSSMPTALHDVVGGWRATVIPDVEECYIDIEFAEPTNITYFTMRAYEIHDSTWTADCDLTTYVESRVATREYSFVGNFKIQGKPVGAGASWVDLYTGSNTTNITKHAFMTDNVEYYTYYRLLILDNDSLTTPDPTTGNFPVDVVATFDKNYYGVSGMEFHSYEYEASDPGTGHVVLYSFEGDTSNRELHVVNAEPVAGSPINTQYDTNTNVEGTINMSSFEDEDILTSRYTINVDEVGSSTDYFTSAVGDSVTPVISGTTGVNGTIGTTQIVQDSLILSDGYMDVTGETKIENGYIYSNLSGQQVVSYSDSVYDFVTDITYTTVVSGTVASGTVGDVTVTGYTNRYESTDTSLRGSFYQVALTDVVGTGTITEGTELYLWHQKTELMDVDFSTHDSIVFEITSGGAYDCRLTAWDDVTHSTTINHLIAGDYVRVSALAFRAEGTVLEPGASSIINNYIASPIHNRIFKGNTVYEGVNYYYGDFDLSNRTESNMIGDYLIFKPMLYGVDETIPYGIHDHVIVLHYTYT